MSADAGGSSPNAGTLRIAWLRVPQKCIGFIARSWPFKVNGQPCAKLLTQLTKEKWT